MTWSKWLKCTNSTTSFLQKSSYEYVSASSYIKSCKFEQNHYTLSARFQTHTGYISLARIISSLPKRYAHMNWTECYLGHLLTWIRRFSTFNFYLWKDKIKHKTWKEESFQAIQSFVNMPVDTHSVIKNERGRGPATRAGTGEDVSNKSIVNGKVCDM